MVPCPGDVGYRRGSHGSGVFELRQMLTFRLGLRSLVLLWDRRE